MAAAALHLVLVHPEIPQNTGSIGRLCAYASVRLHLIHPLGFQIDDRQLRRAGMDYWRRLDVHEHPDWATFRAAASAPARLWLLTSHGPTSLWQARFCPEDGLVLGSESRGVPPAVAAEFPAPQRLAIPRYGAELRSLNLACAAAVAAYEARRQLAGGLLPPAGS